MLVISPLELRQVISRHVSGVFSPLILSEPRAPPCTSCPAGPNPKFPLVFWTRPPLGLQRLWDVSTSGLHCLRVRRRQRFDSCARERRVFFSCLGEISTFTVTYDLHVREPRRGAPEEPKQYSVLSVVPKKKEEKTLWNRYLHI